MIEETNSMSDSIRKAVFDFFFDTNGAVQKRNGLSGKSTLSFLRRTFVFPSNHTYTFLIAKTTMTLSNSEFTIKAPFTDPDITDLIDPAIYPDYVNITVILTEHDNVAEPRPILIREYFGKDISPEEIIETFSNETLYKYTPYDHLIVYEKNYTLPFYRIDTSKRSLESMLKKSDKIKINYHKKMIITLDNDIKITIPEKNYFYKIINDQIYFILDIVDLNKSNIINQKNLIDYCNKLFKEDIYYISEMEKSTLQPPNIMMTEDDFMFNYLGLKKKQERG